MSEATAATPGSGPVPAPGAVTPEPRFEDALTELEQLVGRLERGETGLEDALASWERGEELVRFCLSKLDAAQGRIDELGGDATDGPDA